MVYAIVIIIVYTVISLKFPINIRRIIMVTLLFTGIYLVIRSMLRTGLFDIDKDSIIAGFIIMGGGIPSLFFSKEARNIARDGITDGIIGAAGHYANKNENSKKTSGGMTQSILGQCPYCRKEVSRLASKCPYCKSDL